MSGRRQRNLALLTVALATLLTFAPALSNNFTWWDDHRTIHHNPDFNPPSWSAIARYWRHPHMDLYVPVTYSVWGATAMAATLSAPDEEGIWLNPALFHGVSLLAHMVSACLVFFILLRIFNKAWPACAGALLFAVHPVQVESVAWASGLKDLLAGLFALAALHQYILFRQSRLESTELTEPNPASARQYRLHYFAGGGFLILAILSKPSAVATPLLCAAYDLTIARRGWRSTALAVGPWLALVLPIIYLARHVQPAMGVPFVPWNQRPLVALDALTFYMGKILWPIHLAFDYGRTPQVVLAGGWVWATALVPVVLAIAVILLRHRAPALAFSACAFLIPLLPVLGLVPFEFQGFSTVADHYLYVAMFAPACALVWLLIRWRYAALVGIAALVIALLAVRSAMQTRYWADDIALYSHAIQVNPRSAVSYVNRAAYLLTRGRKADALQDALKAKELLDGKPSSVDELLGKIARPATAPAVP